MDMNNKKKTLEKALHESCLRVFDVVEQLRQPDPRLLIQLEAGMLELPVRELSVLSRRLQGELQRAREGVIKTRRLADEDPTVRAILTDLLSSLIAVEELVLPELFSYLKGVAARRVRQREQAAKSRERQLGETPLHRVGSVIDTYESDAEIHIQSLYQGYRRLEWHDGIKPEWNAETGELFYDGVMVRRLGPGASNIRLILDAFEEEGWPPSILDPLPAGPNSERLKNACKKFRDGTHTLEIRPDGTGRGVRWILTS